MVGRAGVRGADADDVVQAVFLVAYRRLAADEVRRVRPWLRGVVSRVVAAHFRRDHLRRRRCSEYATEVSQAADTTPLRQLEAFRAKREVWAVLGEMPSRLRDVLILAELEGYWPREIAAQLKIPVNTVRSRRHLAMLDFSRRVGRRRAGSIRRAGSVRRRTNTRSA